MTVWILVLLLLCVTAPALEDNAVGMGFVSVDSQGNAPCPLNGKGAVAYAFEMGATEVTNAQYTRFLNAVARDGDPHELYDPNMETGLFGGIRRIEEQGRYLYEPLPLYEMLPVVYVSWYDAVRFCNWLQTGVTEGDATHGAYDTSSPVITRNKGARYALPTVDEWIKAGFFDPARKENGGYWRYATRSDAKPECTPPHGTANSANYFDGRWAAPEPYLTSAGAYTEAKSPWGTFDQAGNVMEWVESAVGDRRGIVGGDATKFDYALSVDYADAELPDQELYIVGFRVVRLGAVGEGTDAQR